MFHFVQNLKTDRSILNQKKSVQLLFDFPFQQVDYYLHLTVGLQRTSDQRTAFYQGQHLDGKLPGVKGRFELSAGDALPDNSSNPGLCHKDSTFYLLYHYRIGIIGLSAKV